jgi:hypothetical protein
MRRGFFSLGINPSRWLCGMNVLGPRGCEQWTGKSMMPPFWAAPSASVDVDVAAVKDGSPPLYLLSLGGCLSRLRSREKAANTGFRSRADDWRRTLFFGRRRLSGAAIPVYGSQSWWMRRVQIRHRRLCPRFGILHW